MVSNARREEKDLFGMPTGATPRTAEQEYMYRYVRPREREREFVVVMC